MKQDYGEVLPAEDQDAIEETLQIISQPGAIGHTTQQNDFERLIHLSVSGLMGMAGKSNVPQFPEKLLRLETTSSPITFRRNNTPHASASVCAPGGFFFNP